MSSRCRHNMVNFCPLAAEIFSLVWDSHQISTGFASWQRYFTASSSGRQPKYAALNRGRHLYSAGRPSRWALAHISSISTEPLSFETSVTYRNHRQSDYDLLIILPPLFVSESRFPASCIQTWRRKTENTQRCFVSNICESILVEYTKQDSRGVPSGV